MLDWIPGGVWIMTYDNTENESAVENYVCTCINGFSIQCWHQQMHTCILKITLFIQWTPISIDQLRGQHQGC